MKPKAYEGKEPFAFVSYSHKDSRQILPIIGQMQEQGFRIWYDDGIEAGSEWPEYIAEHLDGCEVFLAFLTKNSLESHNCYREVNFAIELKKEILVIFLEEVTLSLGMRMQLGVLQAIHRNRYGDDASFAEALCRSKKLAPCEAERPVQPAPPARQESIVPKGVELYRQGKRNELFRLAESCNSPKEQFLLAQSLEKIGLQKDGLLITELYILAAKQGYKQAQYALGMLNEMEGDWLVPDADGVKWFKEAAMQGHADAQYQLAVRYEKGIGIPRNYEEAFYWYGKAAEQNHPQAQYSLGDCYFFRRGTECNQRKGTFWYQKAAEQGYAEAQYYLGVCYDAGWGVSRDETEALSWIRKAAEQGHLAAMEYLKRKT